MYPKEYINFLVHFHGDRDFFECHEILEDYWKRTQPRNKKSILAGLILLAVSNYHHRRDNFPGAGKTLKKAQQIFDENKQHLPAFGFHSDKFLNLIHEKIREIDSGKKYRHYNLPIKDEQLLNICREVCRKKGIQWGASHPEVSLKLIHRHKMRDRTEITLVRNMALKKKKGRES